MKYLILILIVTGLTAGRVGWEWGLINNGRIQSTHIDEDSCKAMLFLYYKDYPEARCARIR